MQQFYKHLILLVVLYIFLISTYAQKSNIYANKKIFPTMAGSGDPWSALTKKRLQIMIALHHGLNITQLAEVFNTSENQMKDEINPLIKSSLVKVENNNYFPDVLIADKNEAEKVYLYTKNIGIELSEALIADWSTLENSFSDLSISKSYTLKDQGFMLVGSRILDLGVLGVLVRDKSLLLSAPYRPSPKQPDGKYYFWIVEGAFVYLGKYGQDDTDLKWTNWHILNFGQGNINGKWNKKRNEFEEKIQAIIELDTLDTPEKFAEKLRVPFLNKDDSKIWEEVSTETSIKLFKILKNNETEIKSFYGSLRTSEYSNNSFGEFFCWFYHLVYAWAIDDLIEKEMIIIPSERYSGIVIYREGEEGLLSQ